MSKANHLEDIELVMREMIKSQPGWPVHLAAQAGMVCKESGALLDLCITKKYSLKKDVDAAVVGNEEIRLAALRTIAASLRLLWAIDKPIKQTDATNQPEALTGL